MHNIINYLAYALAIPSLIVFSKMIFRQLKVLYYRMIFKLKIKRGYKEFRFDNGRFLALGRTKKEAYKLYQKHKRASRKNGMSN